MRLRSRVFRAHDPRWSFAPISGEGAALHGGRFNPRGVPALYASFLLETAWREAQQGFTVKVQPALVCAYDVDCADVLDLTTAAGLAEADMDAADLAAPWRDLVADGMDPPTWAVARRLIGRGVAGVVVPSFAPGAGPADRNAVFWRWGDAPPHRVIVVDDLGRLPRDGRSWS
ncbi:RES family NAD+ phosphorylase [Roseomonas sp. CCTCC AB2023176]|uniref:RES family NAD+ phosphorylase n=1 Tax=Roseomonas sp. CCTCC AB2023176 TaxID=3342640 RepID=UPI0035DB99D4